MKTIGFIGLGIMGNAMATNLQKAGYQLVVYNRTKEKASQLVAKGAQLVDSPAMVAEKVDTLFTMLATPEAVEETAWGPRGFAEILKKDALWVDCSTVNPSFSRQMSFMAKSRNLRFMDAPVAGSKAPAENGELIFLVGGSQVDLDEVRPMLEAMGKKVLHMGDNGKGAALKMVFNYCLGMSMVAFTEAISLGKSLGLDEERIVDIISGSPVMAPNVALKKDKILNSEYSPEFPLKWLHKDMHLATLTGYQQNVALPAGNVAKELYQMAKAGGHGDDDFSVIFGFMQKLSGQ